MYFIYTNNTFTYIENDEILIKKFIEDPKLKIYDKKKREWILPHQLTNFKHFPSELPRASIDEENYSTSDKEKRWKLWINKVKHDFFPPRRSLDETGIHAKLNYHVIVEGQTRKLSYLFILIIIFSLVVFTTLYIISINFDPVMSDIAIEGYTSLIYEIKEAGITEEPDLEKNTEYYWTVYYIRYLTVRILLASVLVSVLLFLIRVYMRIREDRSVTIQREEALSALQYIARGEWAYQYDIDGNYALDPATNLPRTLPYIKGKDYSTRELMNTLPVDTLFTTPDLDKSSSRRKRKSKEPDRQHFNRDKIFPIVTQLGTLSIRLADLLHNLEQNKDKKEVPSFESGDGNKDEK